MANANTDRSHNDTRRRSFAARTGLDCGCLLIVLAGIGVWQGWPTAGIVLLAIGGASIFLKEAIAFYRTGFFGFYAPIFEQSDQLKDQNHIGNESRSAKSSVSESSGPG